ncbi:hypothetical protein OTERR_01480 [Oryzomicrobium terrae]|uniref:Polymer-forming cytoskeletal protein n=2 Tax=Oryzomicrobium terrae TaxID=1735038 RepID=A0A5C1E4I1_9RHOO|nr:hypothetical protein OTERR_01480 [Oryzomicrobium terrae]
MMGLLLLALSCAVLFLLPLVPAALEWWRPSDNAPLRVVREYDGSISHFAASFQRFVDAQLRPYLEQARSSAGQVEGALANGTRIIAVAPGQPLHLDDEEEKRRECERLILSPGDLTLPGERIYSGEIFAQGAIHGGPGLVLRAALAKGDIDLAAESYVMRWIHAEGEAVVGVRSRLYGRASAVRRLAVGPGSQFGRIFAPRIEFTPVAPPARPARLVLQRRPALALPSRVQANDVGRWLVRGDLAVQPQCWHRGHLIAAAGLQVGEGAFVAGSVKGNRDVTLAAGSCVLGSVVAAGSVFLAQDSRALGPIVAEDVVEIGPGCVVGTPEHPTTITAPHIRVAPGALVHGSVWAREGGEVLA